MNVRIVWGLYHYFLACDFCIKLRHTAFGNQNTDASVIRSEFKRKVIVANRKINAEKGIVIILIIKAVIWICVNILAEPFTRCFTHITHIGVIASVFQDIFREFLNNRDEVLALATSMLEAHIDDVPESDSMTRYALESKQAELDKMQKRIDRLMDMRMDGEITADVFMKQSTETQMKIDSLKDAIEALMPKKEDTVTNYGEKMEMLRFALSQYNAPEYFENGIPESVIDAYVEKIVVFEDHFEWYLRFGGNDPLKCRVNGKKDANPEVIFGDSPSSLTELEKHRLL